MSNGVMTSSVHAYTPRENSADAAQRIASSWKVVKRDGREEAFQVGKIRSVIRKCLVAGLGWSDATAEPTIVSLSTRVVNYLNAQGTTRPTVEDLQRAVIAQLWAEGLADAAEHYTLYREERRRARLHRPIPADVAERVTADRKHFSSDIQYYQFMSKFSRWREAEGRRETWHEAVHQRIMPWLFNRPKVRGLVSQAEQAELTQAVYDLEVSPAMRVTQMAGPALDRCNVGAFNCAYLPISDPFALAEMLYILMQGTGAGFSVEREYIDNLPRVEKWKGNKPETIVVEDSTDSWCDAYYQGLQRWWAGFDVWFDVTPVRKKGSRLKTKGGRASGPEPFLALMTYARNLFKKRAGSRLTDTDVHRLACMTGKIVQVGGVRRAATISLSDLDSLGMRAIKSGNWWANDPYGENGRHLSMANNSATYDYEDGVVPVETFMEEWLALTKSKAGERGIFNRQAALAHKPARRQAARFGCNPCAEIILRPFGFCNLSIAIPRPDETPESLRRKVRLAAVIGTIQATATDFKYIRPEWKRNADEEALLGVDITAHADCPLLRYGAPGREQLLNGLRDDVAAVNQTYARRFQTNVSAANTTVKPSGDSAVMFNCGSGISDWFADFFIRWVRESKESPVAKLLLDAGVMHAEAPEDPSLLVFGFPRRSPEGAPNRHSKTAPEQFLNWLEWKKNWAEHSVSTTIYVEDHEWPELGGLVYKNIHHVTGVSFLPKDNGTYTYAPNEEVSEARYNELMSTFPDIQWSKLPQYEHEDMTESSQTVACSNGSCSF